ncbi:PHB depolymerase family esterase [Frankia sp. CiP3]|uniref:alpha/beta hydrolase family esterase n=1 Tax=Frankia sp. CiP3 TaxID=2880971 RepID=UPI001EF40273|nr:alpha/beta hydrolase [Frankia sp. CiP3]
MVQSTRRRTALARFTGLVLVLTCWLAGCAAVGRSHPASMTPVAGAPSPTAGPDAYERSGRTPRLRITLPPATSPRPFPLVIALHSLLHEGQEPQTEWGIDTLATSAGVAMAYPDGLNASWDAGTCCGRSAAEHIDDVGWLRALISHLEQHYPIDRRRVILVGFSNGGMLAYRYACENAPEIAGIAVVAASLQTPDCAPEAPVSVVAVHGQLDERVPYAGADWSATLGTSLTSVENSLAPFRASAGCPPPSLPEDSGSADSDGLPVESASSSPPNATSIGTPGYDSHGQPAAEAATTSQATAVSPAGSGFPVTKKETSCSSGDRVVEFLLPGVAHGWPPSDGPARFSTTEVIWRILAPMRSQRAGPDL